MTHRSALERLFAPASIAVVGASDSPEKAGGALFSVVSGFAGTTIPVNPRVSEVGGRTTYPSVRDIPESVDLVMVAVPAGAVPAVIADCIATGVGGAVICSGGFGESGPEGEELQRQVAEMLLSSDLRVLGPNTSGFLAPHLGLAATFMPGADLLPAGRLGIVAQSGGVNLASAFAAAERGVGISTAVGLGNAVDVGFADAIDFLAADSLTFAIAVYLEGVVDGRRVMQAVRRASDRKPVIAFKVGRSETSEFARSHTGVLAGNWEVARAALRQAGAVVVDSFSDLIDVAAALSVVRIPASPAPGVGIVTGQAGPGLIIADALRGDGVSVPELGAPARRRLRELLPPLTFQSNPVDTGRPDDGFAQVIDAVASDPAIDALVVYALQESGTRAAIDQIVERALTGSSPVVVVSGGPSDDLATQRQLLVEAGVVFSTAPDSGATIAAGMISDATTQALERLHPDTEIAPGALLGAPGMLDENASKDVLASMGVATPQRRVCSSLEEAEAALAAMTAPVVVKVLDANVVHKSAAGGVVLGIHTSEQLRSALEATARAATGAARWLVEEQVEQGIELIIGGIADPSFGPALLVGAGGITVEWATPPVVRTVPLSRAEAEGAVAALPEALRVALGEAATSALAETVLKVGDFLGEHPEILELDINPLRVTGRGLIALDAVVRLGER